MSRRVVGNPVIIAIDVVSVAVGLYGVVNVLKLELSEDLQNAGHFQFLTNLSLIYTVGVFIIGLVGHLTRSSFLFDLKTIYTLLRWP